MKALVLGTCMSLPLAHAGQRSGSEVDQYLYGSRRQEDLEPIRAADPSSYDCCIVVPALRHVLEEASGERNELVFWRAEDAATLLEDCDVYLTHMLGELGDLLSGTTVLVVGFLEPSASHIGVLQRYDDGLDFKEFVHDLNKCIKACTRARNDMWFVDSNPIVDGLGRDGFQDDVYASSTHASFVGDFDFELDAHRIVKPTRATELFDPGDRNQRYGTLMWQELERVLEIIRSGQQIKLIVVDLDDTLWRGTAAEADFSIPERRGGWPLGLVEALLIYKRRGGLLAICSKNSRDETILNLEKIWGGILRLEDFASVQISWDDKAEGIARILVDVNVLPANTLFIDDNPRELEQVRLRFPAVNTCGENHYLWRQRILCAADTQVPRITGESNVRTALVQGGVRRAESKRELTRDEWLRSLNLCIAVDRVASPTDALYPRAAELLNKTNQFNTTGKRWSSAEIDDLFTNSGWLLAVSLTDRFVDNGVIGVVVIAGNTIVQAVLSCRVFGLGAEVAMLQVACRMILDDHDVVVGQLESTDSNFVCQDIYQRLGFTADDGRWVSPEPPAFPEWISLPDPGVASAAAG